MLVELLAALAVGYLVGSVPTAAWIARARGKDVFSLGSGNMGAMNTARNLTLGLGVLVLALDVAKGALATYLGLFIAAASAANTPGVEAPALAAPLVAGFGAVLGHAFSMFVGFRGGKALATTLGVSLPLYPQVGLAALILIVALYLIVRRAGLAAIITMLAYPFLALLTLDRSGWPREDSFAVVTGVLPIVAIVLLKHLLAWRNAPKAKASDVTASEAGSPQRRQ